MLFATILTTSSKYHRGSQKPIWEPPSGTDHYKEKHVSIAALGHKAL